MATLDRCYSIPEQVQIQPLNSNPVSALSRQGLPLAYKGAGQGVGLYAYLTPQEMLFMQVSRLSKVTISQSRILETQSLHPLPLAEMVQMMHEGIFGQIGFPALDSASYMFSYT